MSISCSLDWLTSACLLCEVWDVPTCVMPTPVVVAPGLPLLCLHRTLRLSGWAQLEPGEVGLHESLGCQGVLNQGPMLAWIVPSRECSGLGSSTQLTQSGWQLALADKTEAAGSGNNPHAGAGPSARRLLLLLRCSRCLPDMAAAAASLLKVPA